MNKKLWIGLSLGALTSAAVAIPVTYALTHKETNAKCEFKELLKAAREKNEGKTANALLRFVHKTISLEQFINTLREIVRG